MPINHTLLNTHGFSPPSSHKYPYQDDYAKLYPPHYTGPDGHPTSYHLLEIRLMRQVSDFGFRIMGGKEDGLQVSISEEL